MRMRTGANTRMKCWRTKQSLNFNRRRTRKLENGPPCNVRTQINGIGGLQLIYFSQVKIRSHTGGRSNHSTQPATCTLFDRLGCARSYVNGRSDAHADGFVNASKSESAIVLSDDQTRRIVQLGHVGALESRTVEEKSVPRTATENQWSFTTMSKKTKKWIAVFAGTCESIKNDHWKPQCSMSLVSLRSLDFVSNDESRRCRENEQRIEQWKASRTDHNWTVYSIEFKIWIERIFAGNHRVHADHARWMESAFVDHG